MPKNEVVPAIAGFDLKLMIEANVTKDDIVAIATTAREEHLLSDQTRLTIEMNKVREKIVQAESKLEVDKEKFVASKTKTKAKELERALAALGFKVDVDTCEQKRTGSSIKYKFSLGGDRGYHRHDIVSKKSYSISLPKTILSAERKISAMKVDDMELQEKIFEIKKSLSNMQGMERKAKAALAIAALQGSKAGKAILNQLRGVVALPQPPREK